MSVLLHFVVYDTASGEVRWRGADEFGAAGQTDLPPVLAAMNVPQAAIIGAEVDLDPIRVSLAATVDAQAEAARAPFLTRGEGQMLTYAYKADEARAWEADNSVPTPFLAAEAEARGMTVAALAAEVLEAVALWTTIGAAIEAARMGAKTAIAGVTTLTALAGVSTVDWTGIVTALLPTPAISTAPNPPA